MRAAAAKIDFLRAAAVSLYRLRDASASQFQQGGLYVFRPFPAYKFALQPGHVEQIASRAPGWRQGEERFFEHLLQQCWQHFAGCRPRAIVIVWLAGMLRAPGIHQQVARATVETGRSEEHTSELQ